jgi:hypothetical protein
MMVFVDRKMQSFLIKSVVVFDGNITNCFNSRVCP